MKFSKNILLSLVVLSAVAHAQTPVASGNNAPPGAEPNPVKLVQTLEVVTKVVKDGKTVEQLVDTEKRKPVPGDVLVNTFRTEISGTKKITNISLPVAVPANTVFISQQCSSAEVKTLFSLDGKKNFAEAPLMKKVTVTENGKQVTKDVAAEPKDYKAVQWKLPDMAAGTSVSCSTRLQVK